MEAALDICLSTCSQRTTVVAIHSALFEVLYVQGEKMPQGIKRAQNSQAFEGGASEQRRVIKR